MASCPCLHPTTALQTGCSSLPTTILAVILNSGPEITNRCTLEGVSGENLASIPKSGHEIKNRCSLWAVSGENLASIRKSGPEIKNRCTLEGVSGETPAAIPKLTPSNQESLHTGGRFLVKTCSVPKSGLEIKNRCIGGGSGVLQAEPFSFAATKNRIGCGRPLRRRPLQAGHSPLQLRKLESDADLVAATAAAGETILCCDNEN